ncbi:hypothetical protein BDI4_190072 [Burkholderia diffusa]|nr:hypothetical protein BDI4_190072 [Burkholderia diffusa]
MHADAIHNAIGMCVQVRQSNTYIELK